MKNWVSVRRLSTALQKVKDYIDGRQMVVETATVPISSWTSVSGGYQARISNAKITVNTVVDVIVKDVSLDAAMAAGIGCTTNTEAGKVVLTAERVPAAAITCSLIIKEVKKL